MKERYSFRKMTGIAVSAIACLFFGLAATASATDRDLGGEPIWVYDSDWPVKHVETADLNGDGTPDVISGEYSNDYYGYPHSVFVVDGKSGGTVWTYGIDDGARSMTIGDLNDDGTMDVIVGASYNSGDTPDGRIHAIDGKDGTALWTFYTGATNQDVCVGYFNGDIYPDVAVACFDDYVYAIDGQTGTELWRRLIGSMWVNTVDARDVNDDGIDDVAYAHEYLANYDNYLGVLDGSDGSIIWDMTVSYVVLDAMIEDIDSDGDLEAIFAGIYGDDHGALFVRNALNGDLEWEYDLGSIDHTNGQLSLHAFDIDEDGDLDLVIGNNLGWRTVIAFNGDTNTPMYESDSLDGYPRDISVGDVTDDGNLEIVAATYDRVQVISAQDGSKIWYYAVDGGIYAVSCADFDDDKAIDIAAGGNAENVGWPPNPDKTVWALKTVESPLYWELEFGQYGNALAIDDLNGDVFLDVAVVASSDDWVWAIDGETGTELWRWTGTENLYAVTTGDFDNDGQIDVAVGGADDKVTALNGADGSFMWEFTTPGDQIYRKCLQATDLNGDGNIDVIAGSDDGTIYAINGMEEKGPLWSSFFYGGDAEEIELADMNGIEPLDVVAIVGGRLVVLDGADGSVLWEYTTNTQYAAHCEVMDANDDGILDVAIGVRKMGATPGRLIMVNGSTHTEMWTVTPFLPCSDYGLAHGNLTWDKAEDLVAGGNYDDKTVYAFDGLTGAELWSYTTGGEINCVLGYDINNDDQDDVLVGSDDQIVYALDGATGDPFWEYSTAGDVMQIKVGDISGDGAANIACVTFDSDGLVYAFTALYEPGCCVGMRGNVDGDPLDEINIADLVYLVNYMFNEGSESPCFEEADVNGNGPLDIADLVYLVQYMFSGGPDPEECP